MSELKKENKKAKIRLGATNADHANKKGKQESKFVDAKILEDKSPDAKALEDKYKRALADYQNLVKQTARERQEFVKYANEQVILELLPVYDNLKMSLEHADKETEKNGWLKGVQYVVKQFGSILKDLGVEEIKTEREKFNPELMEAVEGKGNKVKKEVKPGYKLRGKVIVAARVIVG